MTASEKSALKKVGLWALITFGSFPILVFSCLSFFLEERATYEKIKEVRSQELNEQKDLQTYMTLLEIGNNHRQELVDRMVSTDTSSYFNFPLNNSYADHKLPKSIATICDSLASRLSGYKSASFQISRLDNGVSLHISRTDHDNYLYINNRLYFAKDSIRYDSFENPKEKIIGGRYRYVVGIMDAFDHIDPNGLW